MSTQLPLSSNDPKVLEFLTFLGVDLSLSQSVTIDCALDSLVQVTEERIVRPTLTNNATTVNPESCKMPIDIAESDTDIPSRQCWNSFCCYQLFRRKNRIHEVFMRLQGGAMCVLNKHGTPSGVVYSINEMDHLFIGGYEWVPVLNKTVTITSE